MRRDLKMQCSAMIIDTLKSYGRKTEWELRLFCENFEDDVFKITLADLVRHKYIVHYDGYYHFNYYREGIPND